IAKNLQVNEVDCTRYQIFQSDLFQNITGQFDYILSNPPYVDPAVDRVQPSVKAFEPEVSLYGGEAGLAVIKRIITEAQTHLTPTGTLYLEHEPEQTDAITELAEKLRFSATTHLDQYGVLRYSSLKQT